MSREHFDFRLDGFPPDRNYKCRFSGAPDLKEQPIFLPDKIETFTQPVYFIIPEKTSLCKDVFFVFSKKEKVEKRN